MKFFLLRNTPEAAQWRFGMTNEEEGRTKLLERYSVSFNEEWNIQEPLALELWFQYLDNPTYANLGYCDIHDWIGNNSINPPLMGKPVAFFTIISEKVKEALQTLKIPPFRFYAVNAFKRDTGEVRNYWIFHLLDHQSDYVDYSKTEIQIVKGTTLMEVIERGSILSHADFLLERDKLKSKDRRATLRLSNIVYKEKFDVLWGDSGEILFSTNATVRFDNLQLRGVEKREYKHNIEFL